MKTVESYQLPGTKSPNSVINLVYSQLKAGKTLTSLSTVETNSTVSLAKYISILRKTYKIPVKDHWIQGSNRKRKVKIYFLRYKDMSN
jgi:hypothetical protein